MGGAPAGYDAEAYGRDFRRFRSLLKRATPHTMILGPGTIGDAATASRLLAASGPGLDGFSYHYYGALSARCHGNATPETASTRMAWSNKELRQTAESMPAGTPTTIENAMDSNTSSMVAG